MKHVLKNERGMALGLAILALTVVGAIVAGALFSGIQEQRVSENVQRAQVSFGVAEEGAYDIIRSWDSTRAIYAALYSFPANPPAKSAVTINRKTSASGTGSYWGTLFKLNDELYVVDVTAQDNMSLTGRIRGGGASQRVGLLVRTKPIVLPPPAALITAGSSVLTGKPTINGYDQIPPRWTGCGPTDSAVVGVRTQLNDSVITRHPSDRPTIVGQPPTLRDPTLADSSFSKYGDVTYAQLASRADVTLSAQTFSNAIAPATTGSTCNTNVPTNWGSPTNPTGPCGAYFPIVHITGTDAVISGREGQGVLLVDGSLNVQGGFQFFGVAIIKGALNTGGGANFWGTVVVQDSASVSDTTNSLAGNSGIQYSKCAIVKALDKTGVASQLRSRAWTQLY